MCFSIILSVKNTIRMYRYTILIISIIIFCSCNQPKLNNKESDKSIPKTSLQYHLSLAQWSLHKTFFGEATNDWKWFINTLNDHPDSVLKGEENPSAFPKIAHELGFNQIELVNTFYFGKVNDVNYWNSFNDSCKTYGVKVVLIMCDALGDIGSSDSIERVHAVNNHKKWIDIASQLKAKSIRVNASGLGTEEEVAKAVVKSLIELAVYAGEKNVNVLVENHYGYSSNGKWLASVINEVNKRNVGTLPDFGNFCIEQGDKGCIEEYDMYKGMKEIMPFAFGVSAKSRSFNSNGCESTLDYYELFRIVKESGFNGVVGVEYEGDEITEFEGIIATRKLINKVLRELE